jgi:ABC-type antimicrobial peptide transport system permease subunit
LADANEVRDWRIYSDFAQVLIESVVIALLGAALGVVASLGFVKVLEEITPTPMHRSSRRWR